MRITLRSLVFAGICVISAYAQKGSTGGSVGTGGSTSTGGTTGGSTSPGTTGTQPTNNPTITNPSQQPTSTAPPPPRPIFLSGKVITDDGSPLPMNVTIQSVCGSQQRSRTHPSNSGDFGFEWNGTNTVFEDASDNARFGSASSAGGGSSGGSSSGITRVVDPLNDCDLRASAPGYTSTRVSLFNRSSFDSFDIGNIVLHRVSGEEGRTVSALALKAPKDAKKNFDKGTAQAKSKKNADAMTSFQKAVDIYPQYADAWYGLGMAEMQTGTDAAKEAAQTHFKKAMELDDKLVGPWQELGYLAADQRNWADAAKYLDRAVKLDPVGSPMAWYFSAVSNYNLAHFDEAERSIRAEMKLDKNPQAQFMLGLTLIARKDFRGGADALKTFIAAAPQSGDVAMAKKQLLRIESLPAQ